MCGCLRRHMQKIKIPKNQNPSSHPHPDGSGEDPTIMGPMPVDPAIVSSMAADPAVAGLAEVDPSAIGYRAARRWPSRAEPVPEEARVGRRPLLPTTRCCGAEPAACRSTPEVPPAAAQATLTATTACLGCCPPLREERMRKRSFEVRNRWREDENENF